VRLQLTSGAVALAALAAVASPAAADDRIGATTTWFQEAREGGLGGLTVIHPQVDVGVDAGEHVGVDLGWSADVVSGATATVYTVDAISTATTFDDLRNEGHFGLTFRGKRSSLTLSTSAGVERDYASITAGGSGAIDLPGKNTNLALSYTHNFDAVCDKDNAMVTPLERRALTGADPCEKEQGLFGKDTPGVTVWRDVTIDTAQATATQNLSPTTVMQLSLWGQVIDGFQSNPYRRVRVGATEPQEQVPEVRGRIALTARLNRFLPALRSAVHFDLRGYSDTWGVDSGSLEMGYSQYAGSNLLFHLRARVHQQTAAAFFKDAFFYETESTAGAYFTGDRELSPIRNVLVGAKLSLLEAAEEGNAVWGIFDRVQLNLKSDIFLLENLPADDLDANPDGIDTQFINGGKLIDAFTVQLGLLLDY
jgi:uncharacterized protein DUF3570